jgi:hypothetical protein
MNLLFGEDRLFVVLFFLAFLVVFFFFFGVTPGITQSANLSADERGIRDVQKVLA